MSHEVADADVVDVTHDKLTEGVTVKVGTRHRLVLPLDRLQIDLQVDPNHPDSYDDQVILTGSDGYEKTLSVVQQGQMHAHEEGMTTLVFEGVKVGVRYTCRVDPGQEGDPYPLFHSEELTPDAVMPPDAN